MKYVLIGGCTAAAALFVVLVVAALLPRRRPGSNAQPSHASSQSGSAHPLEPLAAAAVPTPAGQRTRTQPLQRHVTAESLSSLASSTGTPSSMAPILSRHRQRRIQDGHSPSQTGLTRSSNTTTRSSQAPQASHANLNIALPLLPVIAVPPWQQHRLHRPLQAPHQLALGSDSNSDSDASGSTDSTSSGEDSAGSNCAQIQLRMPAATPYARPVVRRPVSPDSNNSGSDSESDNGSGSDSERDHWQELLGQLVTVHDPTGTPLNTAHSMHSSSYSQAATSTAAHKASRSRSQPKAVTALSSSPRPSSTHTHKRVHSGRRKPQRKYFV